MREFCTIIARNYLAAARVLAASAVEHSPDARVTVLVIDDDDGPCVGDEPFATLHLADVVPDRAERQRMALAYDITELATALKPLLLKRLLAERGRPVAYIDPDVCMYAPLDGLEALVGEHSLVLVPHTTTPLPRDGRRPDDTDILGSGAYNLGFVAVGTGSEPFLDWWADRCRREAIIDPARMRFTDQRWVDLAPGYFPHLILKDPGYDVAYWNVSDRSVTRCGTGPWLVDGHPLRFFHYSGYDVDAPHRLSRHGDTQPRVVLSDRPELATLCDDYRARLIAAGHLGLRSASYGHERLPSGMLLDSASRRGYLAALVAAERAGTVEPPNGFADPHAFVDWLRAPADAEAHPGTTRHMMWLWARRPDLQREFPNPTVGDAPTFVAWAHGHAGAQERLDPALVPDITTALWPAPPGPPTDVGVNVLGYFEAELGVGEYGRLTLAAIEAAGEATAVEVSRRTNSRQLHAFGRSSSLEVPFDITLICANADSVGDLVARHGPGWLDGRHRIGLWSWELEEFPPELYGAFDEVDEVWANSEFAATAIRAASGAIPVHVVAPGVLIAEPPPFDRTTIGLPPDRPVLGFLFDFDSVFERKNPDGLVHAFRRAFTHVGEAHLLIKSINGDRHLDRLEQLRWLVRDRADITLVDAYLSSDERRGLLATLDGYVSLHRSEGFGLTIAEAMAVGTPVIATGYSANLEFMDATTGILVPWVPAHVPEGAGPYRSGASWAEPDLDAAAAAMRAIIDDPAAAARRAALAKAQIAAHHGIVARAEVIRARLDEIRSERAAAVRARDEAALQQEELREAVAVASTSRPADRLALVSERIGNDPVHLPDPSRLGAIGRGTRHAVGRLIRPFLYQQRHIDSGLVEAIAGVRAEVADLRAAIDAERSDRPG